MNLNTNTISIVTILTLLLSISLSSFAQSPPSPLFFPPAPSPFESPTPSPAPSPSIHRVNLTELLTVAGPFHTFLSYLLQTNVIETFQSQANDTKSGGLTLFVPADSAFAALKQSVLSNLTQDQLKTLLLYHAFSHYYSLSDFKNLSTMNPIVTYAGGDYTLNLTYDMGMIHVNSSWSDPKITSSVYSTAPVAIYELDMVLLPKDIFMTEPALAPVPAPPPEEKPADMAPSSSTTGLRPSTSQSSGETTVSSDGVRVCVYDYLVLMISGCLMLLW